MQTFVVAAVLLALAATAAPTRDRVFILHSTAARTSMSVTSQGPACEEPASCSLTKQGVAQATALGQALRRRYFNNGTLNMTTYDVTRIQSVAAQSQRVVQTAQAVLTGAFPDGLPFVDFVPEEQDLQMCWWQSWPSAVMTGGYARNRTEAEQAVRGAVNVTALRQLGANASVDGLCATDIVGCAWYLSDLAETEAMEGRTLDHALDKSLRAVRSALLDLRNGFRPEVDPLQRETGAFGYPLASAMMRLLTTTQPVGGFFYNVTHRAAHPDTLAGFYAATGAWSAATPFEVKDVGFAEAVLVERFTDAAAGGAQTLKAFRALPEQKYNDHYHFHVDVVEIGLRCVSADGVVSYTNETAAGCPVDAVARALADVAPQSPAAECYVSPQTLVATGCDARGAPDPATACYFMRDNCPGNPCAGNPAWVADPARGFACVSLNPPQRRDVSGTAFAITGTASAFGGVVAGLLLMRCRRQSDK